MQRVSPGRTRSTLTSGRSASTPLPAGLATCPWFTLSFAWTLCSSKIRCQSCARSTKTWKGLEKDGQKEHGPWGETLGSGAVSQGRVWSTWELDMKDHMDTDPGGLSWNTCLRALCLSVSPTSTTQSGQREDGGQSVSAVWPLAGERQF